MVEPIPLNATDNAYESICLGQSDEASTDIELKPHLPALRGSGKGTNSASMGMHDEDAEMNQQLYDKNRIADTGDDQMNATVSALHTKRHKNGSNMEDEGVSDLHGNPDKAAEKSRVKKSGHRRKRQGRHSSTVFPLW